MLLNIWFLAQVAAWILECLDYEPTNQKFD